MASVDDTVGRRVLVADDQADVVAALRLLLRPAGFDVDSASSVDEVRRRLDGRRYDLLLMDLNYARDTTSGQEGLELLTEVHARDRTLPVIVMTGWGTIDTAVEAMRRGARTFVHKPWDNDALVRTIAREISDGVASRKADASATREREDAQRIQRALLPSSLPRLPGCDMAASWRPARICSGDCYDAIAVDESRVVLSIADVAGKGLPAALVMAHLQASIRAFSGENAAPDYVMSSTNRALCRNADLGLFVTCFYAIVNRATRRLTYSNAGHNPPLLVRADGRVDRLGDGGMVLGMFDPNPYVSRDLALEPGDRLVLFTDGVVEALNGEGVEFGDDRLIDIALEHRHGTVQTAVDAIVRGVADFTGEATLADDATVVCVGL
jgi:sigma-B regulation protein RsbU (phosphoserine phosphatase)